MLFAMGGYGTYLGFRIRFSEDVVRKYVVVIEIKQSYYSFLIIKLFSYCL